MKQNVFFLLILLLGVTTLSGHAQVSMNILDRSGENKSVGVASIGKITFTEDDLVMNYNNGTAESLNMLSIRKITFSGSPTGIANVIETEHKISVSFNSANQLTVNNLPEGRHQVSIYSVSGSMIQNTTVDSYSPTVQVDNMQQGIYIIRVNNQALKIVKP
jgi:hypothetical protein